MSPSPTSLKIAAVSGLLALGAGVGVATASAETTPAPSSTSSTSTGAGAAGLRRMPIHETTPPITSSIAVNHAALWKPSRSSVPSVRSTRSANPNSEKSVPSCIGGVWPPNGQSGVMQR